MELLTFLDRNVGCFLQRIKAGKFEFAFEPVWCESKILYSEALLRVHSGRADITIETFFSAVEKTEGLDMKIFRLLISKILNNAFDDSIGFNISPNDLMHEGKREILHAEFLNFVRSGGSLQRVFVEVTERSFLELGDEVVQFLSYWGSKGVKFVLDDYGSGYHNFDHLESGLFKVLKLDGHIVQNKILTLFAQSNPCIEGLDESLLKALVHCSENDISVVLERAVPMNNDLEVTERTLSALHELGLKHISVQAWGYRPKEVLHCSDKEGA